MKVATRLVACCFATLLSADVITAGIVPPLDIVELTRKSAVVGTGLIVSVTRQGSGSVVIGGTQVLGDVMVADIRLEHIFKGSPNTNIRGQFLMMPKAPVFFGDVGALEYRLVFLKQVGNHYEFTSPYHPSLPAVPFQPSPTEDPLDAVVAALSAVLASPSVEANEKRSVIMNLARTETPAVRNALRQAVTQTDNAVRLGAAGALLEQRDMSVLPVVEAALLSSDAAIPEDVRRMLRAGIERSAAGASAVPSLGRLSRSTDVQTRRAAVAGLRRTGSRTAVPHLLQALEDQDFDVRYSAVIGLAETTGQAEYGPSIPAFREAETKYVAFWKAGGKAQ